MIKKILLASLFFNSLCSFSQDIVKEFDLKLEKKRDFFQVVNEDKKEVILFLNDKEKVTSIRFDEKFNIIDSLTTARPEKKYDNIIGYSQKDNNYFLFWASENRKEINSQYFNFTKKETKTTSINLELKKEKIVKELTINNVFYLITIVKNTSILKFYISNNDGNLDTKTIDLSNLQFHNESATEVNLYTALTGESSDIFIQNISTDSPPSLSLSSKRFKVYTYKNDEIIFTMDNNTFSTDILKINLNDFTGDLKSIQQPAVAKGAYESITFKSNSFLIDDKILQIKTNPQVLFLTMSDQNGNKINRFIATREEEITFKNSDVFQEIKSIHNKKVLEKPKQFIRKINNSNPGISCYKLNGLYYTVIGSSQDIARAGGGGARMGMGAGVGGGFGGAGFGGAPMSFGFSSSYTIGNLISYKDKNVVYTNCLFDSSFNHLDSKIETSAFEKARLFLEENEDVSQGVSIFGRDLYKDLIVFKFNTTLYLGSYNNQNKKYQIFSFSE
ncbi:hypothetical protein [Flavobacterium pectinovorum]|uniref:Uncharacterized protein n=1 Tax=Flavobacterium pectinovorum TaxID=29533 RepID=A0A502EJ45_9FLAO|nr:hypothetical protein [Flavobacterium pectinovorum]TPG36351.1 hypothetical protein EAH81_19965 [Flavobacterium pectinovorum]